MAIFGRKRIKKVKQGEFVPPVDVRRSIEVPENKMQAFPRRPPVVEGRREEEEPQPAFAPLFVKLTRYKKILNTINYLKVSINLMKNQLSILNELDRLREENLKLIYSAVNRMSDRLGRLDSEFMRPSGFVDEIPETQMEDVESLENTIADLKGQIEHLKSEVETLS